MFGHSERGAQENAKVERMEELSGRLKALIDANKEEQKAIDEADMHPDEKIRRSQELAANYNPRIQAITDQMNGKEGA